MNYIDLVREQFNKGYRNQIFKIKEYISLNKDDCKIELSGLKFNDVNNQIRNSVEFVDDKIKILAITKEFWNDIKFYIPKTITKLEIPFELIESDLKFFKSFQNLRVLVINDSYKLLPKHLKKIYSNTKIREIYVNNIYAYKYADEENFAFTNSPYDLLCYKDLLVKPTKEKQETEKEKQMIYNPFKQLTINTFSLNKNLLERIFKSIKYKKVDFIAINTNNGDTYELFFRDGSVSRLVIKSKNLDDANKFYNYLIDNNYKIKSITIDVNDTDYTKMDFSKYDKLSKKTNIIFLYNDHMEASYESFKGLVESIKWYRSLLTNNLSPAEKVMLIYDVLKTFPYTESSGSLLLSRHPDTVIETGNIVCVGYAYLLCNILNGTDGIKIGQIDVTCHETDYRTKEFHARNIIQIDDDKYNIHGIFALDVTWDSIMKDGKEFLSEEYNALDLYNYFLVPKADYDKVFPNDTAPDLFDEIDDLIKKDILTKEYNNTFYNVISNEPIDEKMTNEVIKKYINTKRPSLETFNQMLYNVRIAEGYPEEEIKKEIDKVNYMNQLLIQKAYFIHGIDIPFFEKGENKK